MAFRCRGIKKIILWRTEDDIVSLAAEKNRCHAKWDKLLRYDGRIEKQSVSLRSTKKHYLYELINRMEKMKQKTLLYWPNDSCDFNGYFYQSDYYFMFVFFVSFVISVSI